ncbi:hypothetical protein GPAL_3144 [Glaciecola pallidula DSM 14239 = ACAM 615]|uniref:Uncharacterized protein n=1 Tax=Brumicola pallidula DSM 14239 = ACAM 615 TaxID=1121922 RepID=K7A3B9_9ALTE|nr:hypothetical protein GPAL_3144 [Glaciecola pallidula DSM 14239 = ACAM 615]
MLTLAGYLFFAVPLKPHNDSCIAAIKAPTRVMLINIQPQIECKNKT